MNDEKIIKRPARIESLQALRALAFLGIFLRHSGAGVDWPTLGVAVFFVMSGFLMVFTHGEEEIDAGFVNNLQYSKKRIKKVYFLHIIAMLFAVILELAVMIKHGLELKPVSDLLLKIVLNIFLLQAWVPVGSVPTALNGAAWYLSASAFLYFMFPYIQNRIKGKSQAFLWVSSAAVILLQLLACLPFIACSGTGSRLYLWFMYINPLFRLGDFYIGCCLGNQYLHREQREETESALKGSAVETAALIITLLVFRWLSVTQTSPLLIALQNKTTIFIPISAMWVYLFALRKGIITRVLSNSVLIWLGNISSYMFLIHLVVIQYVQTVLDVLSIDVPNSLNITVIAAEFALSVLGALLYRKAEKLIKEKKNN